MALAMEALDHAVELLGSADLDSLGAAERYRVLERLESSRRRQIAVAGSMVCRLEQVEGCPPVLVALALVVLILVLIGVVMPAEEGPVTFLAALAAAAVFAGKSRSG